MANEPSDRSYEPPLSVGADHVHAHAQHTGRRWLDLSIALSAIAISVISLFVAIQHGRTEEKLVAASSWPFLVYHSDIEDVGTGNGKVLLTLQNVGVGPARIQSVKMFLDGHELPTRSALLKSCCGLDGRNTGSLVANGLFAQNGIVGVIPPQGSVTFLGWRELPGDVAIIKSLDRIRKRLSFNACYCSVLDECWTTDLKSTSTPQPVKRCPLPAEPFDQ